MSDQPKKIVWPANNRVRELRPWIDEILKALGYPGAMVSDHSEIGDFFITGLRAHRENDLDILRGALGVDVSFRDFVVDVAERLREAKDKQGADTTTIRVRCPVCDGSGALGDPAFGNRCRECDGVKEIEVEVDARLRLNRRCVATEKHCKGVWGADEPGVRFRCYLCGHKFLPGDVFLWLYTNDGEAPGNPLFCLGCDYKNKGRLKEAWFRHYQEGNRRFWWMSY